jgi:hypothetical protein
MSLVETLLAVATYPARVAVAASRTTMQLAALSSAEGPILRSGGYGERLDAVRELMDPGRPLGQAVAEGGSLDRLFAPDGPVVRLVGRGGALERLLAEDGAVERLLAPDGALERLLAPEGALDQLVAEGGVLDRLLAPDGVLDRLTASGGLLETLVAPGGLADRLLADDGYAEKLFADGGTLDQLVALGRTLEEIRPRLTELAALIPSLHDAVDGLGRSVGPLGDLANRLPGTRRRAGTVVRGSAREVEPPRP